MARRSIETAGGEFDVAAAGGVVVRPESLLRARIAAVHRPKYMDWSLPKGKLEDGEGWLDAALREVEEETGLSCESLGELPPVRYVDREGRRKLVRYWLMHPVSGRFEPHDEVDELRWLTGREAAQLLTYDHDRELVRRGLSEVRRRRLRRSYPRT